MKSYGSVGGGGSGNHATSNSPQHPIHLHPTLESLDVGPHAFRNPIPQSQSDSPDTNERRLQCLSMPATLNSPFLRRNFSSPGDKMKADHLTLPQSYDPTLSMPQLQDVAQEGFDNSTEEASKNESKLLAFAFL